MIIRTSAILSLLLLSCDGSKETPVDINTIDTAIEKMDADGDGYFDDEDCDDSESTSHPGAVEICDGVDNNCDGIIDEGVLSNFYFDNDGDGFGDETEWIEACDAIDGYVPNGNDCDDNEASAYPSAPEQCDEIDNDCDGIIDEDLQTEWWIDEDGDGFGDSDYFAQGCLAEEGFAANPDDCDDDNPEVHPDMEEVCDEVDNNCDGQVDEDLTIMVYLDADLDGFGDDSQFLEVCDLVPGYTLIGGDCDDIDSYAYPGNSELCDDVDNNCDGQVDEGVGSTGTPWYWDADGDGYGDSNLMIMGCSPDAGYVPLSGDCDDTDANNHPNKIETCDGQDNNCDGQVDDADSSVTGQLTWYQDNDSDGMGSSVTTLACVQPSGYVSTTGDCNDGNNIIYNGAPELCDNVDNDCDGAVDDADGDVQNQQTWYQDGDGDGNGSSVSLISCFQPSGYVPGTGDCNDGNTAIYAGAPELCDTLDNNCNGLVDDDDALVVGQVTYYADNDADGYGNASQSVLSCFQPSGTVTNAGDCNDSSGSVYPGATEIIGDEIDSNCDGGEICILDADNDGHGNDAGLTQVSSDSDCDDAFEAIAGNTDDCDDSNALFNPTLGCSGTDCGDILNNGWGNTDGIYTIDPDGNGGSAPYDVYCDMTTDGGGWTRITHLHSNRSIGSINRSVPFFTSAWQQNSSTFSNTSNANLVLDNNNYGMLDSTDFLQNATNIRLTCNDNTRNLNARAIWTPSSSQLNSWLAEGTDRFEYQSSPFTVSLSKNGGSFSNAGVYFSHTEDAYFGGWHVCGRLTANAGGFQLGFCHNSPSSGDNGISNANQILLGYHAGYSGLRLECTADTPSNTPIINGEFSIWVR